jgi:hypothetical protein
LIPVLLMLAYPAGYPGPDPAQAVRARASEADRDTTVDILCAAVGDGRLTLDELEDRVGAALSARTRAELAALIADLASRPSTSWGARPAERPARSGPPTPSRWSLLQSLVSVVEPAAPIGSLA